MFLLKRDGFIYLLNAVVFVFIFRSDIEFYNGWIIAITILLITSGLLFKQNYSKSNTFTLGSRRNNLSGIILSFLFLFNLVLLWEEFVLMEVVYVIVFSLVQERVNFTYTLRFFGKPKTAPPSREEFNFQ